MKGSEIKGEIKGKIEIERGRERVNRMKRMNRIVKGIMVMVVMFVMGCNSGGVKGGEVNLEAKNSFLE